MGSLKNIVTSVHESTKRDYFGRMKDDKVHCMQVARKFDKEFFDGARRYGYGGYQYIENHWAKVANQLIDDYGLKDGSKVLDVGCGKGYLLYEIKKINPKIQVAGFDISKYSIDNSHPEVKSNLFVHKAQDHFPLADKEFDLTISLATLHNLKVYELKKSLNEISRVSKQSYIMVESYRNELELFNLECWALTCEAFFDPTEWKWLFDLFDYKGDYEFIFMS